MQEAGRTEGAIVEFGEAPAPAAPVSEDGAVGTLGAVGAPETWGECWNVRPIRARRISTLHKTRCCGRNDTLLSYFTSSGGESGTSSVGSKVEMPVAKGASSFPSTGTNSAGPVVLLSIFSCVSSSFFKSVIFLVSFSASNSACLTPFGYLRSSSTLTPSSGDDFRIVTLSIYVLSLYEKRSLHRGRRCGVNVCRWPCCDIYMSLL